MKKKNMILALVVLCIGLITVGGTYAAFMMTLNASIINGGVYEDSTQCFNINYDAGEDIRGQLFPTASSNGGLQGSLTVGIADNCNVSGALTLNLIISEESDSRGVLTQAVAPHCENSSTLETLYNYNDSSACSSNGGTWVEDGTALKYAVFKNSDTVPMSVGYIDSVGTTLSILNETISGSDSDNEYLIKIWLDGYLSDNSYANQSFAGRIQTKVQQIEDNIANGGLSVSPELDPGMVPVTIANDGVVTTTTDSSSNWYNYNNKKWANAVIVKESGTQTRSYYLNNPGVTVNQEDILGYYVWIPRYKYRIKENMRCSELNNPTAENNPECFEAPFSMSDSDKSLFVSWVKDLVFSEFGLSVTLEQAGLMVDSLLMNGYYEMNGINYSIDELFTMYYNSVELDTITYTGTFNSNNIVTGPRPIDIIFESKASQISRGDAVNTYYTHPAFIWDGRTISGFWVGKFETTGSATTPTVLPNTSSLISQVIGLQLQASFKFAGGILNDNGTISFRGSNTYGIGVTTDTHMMKNSEWGAVVYLSHSIYGINSEIRINNNSYYKTGCGASAENGGLSAACQIAYGSGVASYPQSTTGNITGIFDMSGGAWENVMGVLWDGTADATLSSKYYDLYLPSQFSGDYITNFDLCTLETCGGHATYETRYWYRGYAGFVSSVYPYFARGGDYNDGARAAAFGVNCVSAEVTNSSWRSVFVINGA